MELGPRKPDLQHRKVPGVGVQSVRAGPPRSERWDSWSGQIYWKTSLRGRFYCTAAPGGNYEAPALFAQQSVSLPASSDRGHYDGLDVSGKRRSSADLSLSEVGKGRSRSRNGDRHARGDQSRLRLISASVFMGLCVIF